MSLYLNDKSYTVRGMQNAIEKSGFIPPQRYYIQVLNDNDISNVALVRAVRSTAFDVFHDNRIDPLKARDFLVDWNMRIGNGQTELIGFLNDRFELIDLDTDVLDPSDNIIDQGKGKDWDDNLRCWMKRMFYQRDMPCVVRPVRDEYQPVFKLIGTLIAGINPLASISWPREIASNDNFIIPKAANDNKK